MLNPEIIRADPRQVADRLRYRLAQPSLLDRIVTFEETCRRRQRQIDSMRAERKTMARAIALERDPGTRATMQGRARQHGDRLRDQEAELQRLTAELASLQLQLPNLPDHDVPAGGDSAANQLVRQWSVPRVFDFAPKDHVALGEPLGLDRVRGARASGSGFAFVTGPLARLEIALVSFMLDVAIEHGYEPVIVPDLVNRDAMQGCGQLPKFAEQLYHVATDDLYLVPTAESALSSFHRGEILEARDLPRTYVGFSPCFRREAGGGGVDERGILRVHQFHKVELFQYTDDETSNEALEGLVSAAEDVLQRLELPYQVVLLSQGDTGFAAAKTYDLEVWLPGQPGPDGQLGTYREISSCSNCRDFQARRGDIRYRPAPGAKPRHVHMLNGSGLAVGRTMVAILENFQLVDGSVVVPPALRPYMGELQHMAPSESELRSLAATVPGGR